jgi:ferredoxin
MKPGTRVEEGETFWCRIYMAGDITLAKQVCREYCLGVGLCVTITPTQFIYSGGEEAGFIIELVNYPKFPKGKQEILDRANTLAENLVYELHQHSYLLMCPDLTRWFTRRSSDLKP